MSSIFRRGWISVHVSMGISSLKSYIEEMEYRLSQQLSSIEARYREETENLSAEEAQIVFEYHYEDELHEFQTEFTNILRKSTLISSYSLLEIELKRICLHIEKENSFNIKYSDISGKNGIFKSYHFLKKVAKIDFTNLNKQWSKIQKINKIRNHFVHDDNDILVQYSQSLNPTHKEANQTLKAFKDFDLAIEDKVYTASITDHLNDNKKYDVIVHDKFNKVTLEIIEEFLDQLLKQLKLY